MGRIHSCGELRNDDEENADGIVRPVKERIRYSRGHFAVGKIESPDGEQIRSRRYRLDDLCEAIGNRQRT